MGGGPAGLAAAIHAARLGLRTIVCERASGPPDKACGEGLLPSGVRALADLGVLAKIAPADRAPFTSIRYLLPDGACAQGRLPNGGGLGIRRTALTAALAETAAAGGADLRWGCKVLRHERTADQIVLATSEGDIAARLVIAADGGRSPLRRAEGLDRPVPGGARRFGLRRHFRLAPWNRAVEVHLGDNCEVFCTPAGEQRVGIAVLWDRERLAGPVHLAALLAPFPAVIERLRGALSDSVERAAGPLACAATSLVTDRFALLGDAAGTVDAITGEGVSLALAGAADLAAILPEALRRGATRDSLLSYERTCRQRYRRYAFVARAVLAVVRRPRVRRVLIRNLGAHPMAMEQLLAWAVV